MNTIVYSLDQAVQVQYRLIAHKIPYNLYYVYEDGQRDSMEYWEFEIEKPSKLLTAFLAS